VEILKKAQKHMKKIFKSGDKLGGSKRASNSKVLVKKWIFPYVYSSKK